MVRAGQSQTGGSVVALATGGTLLQTLSLVWGVLAFVGMMISLIPCLGMLNYVNVPFGAVGLVLGVVTVATSKASNKIPAITGLACCAIAIAAGVLRLA
jgi:hypothetical protein